MNKADCIFERRPRSSFSGRWSREVSCAALLVLASTAGIAASANDHAKVTAVRYWSLGDVTRVAIEVDSDFKYRSDRLSEPPRVFFDIRGARPGTFSKGMKTITVGDGLLKQIRIAETQPGVTRVVLDLEKPLEFTVSQMALPARLMVELHGSPAKSTPPPVPVTEATPVSGSRNTFDAKVPAPALSLSAAESAPAEVRMEPIPAAVIAAAAKPARSSILMAKVHTTLPPYFSPAAPAPAPTKSPASAASSQGVPPTPAKRNLTGGQSLTRVLGLKLGRVVLDPGHGGHDVGTHGPTGLYEKDLVLDIAQRLGALLEARLGSEVIYTRSDDTFVPLEERTEIANRRKADLFLSIHANSSPVRSVSGVETYYMNFTTSRTAMDTAARENASSSHSIFELRDLVNKITLKDKVEESREFASRLQTSLYSISVKNNKASKDRGVKKAPFVVLIGAEMPSVLAEIGFLTNASDEALLRKDEHRDKIAEALYKGIAAYAESLSRNSVVAKKQ